MLKKNELPQMKLVRIIIYDSKVQNVTTDIIFVEIALVLKNCLSEI